MADFIGVQDLEVEDEDLFERSTESCTKNISDFKLCDIPSKKYLGSGNFGKVYLAQDRVETTSFFAIKAIRKSKLIDNDIIEMTKLESRIM